jgi:hypothetical protein
MGRENVLDRTSRPMFGEFFKVPIFHRSNLSTETGEFFKVPVFRRSNHSNMRFFFPQLEPPTGALGEFRIQIPMGSMVPREGLELDI